MPRKTTYTRTSLWSSLRSQRIRQKLMPLTLAFSAALILELKTCNSRAPSRCGTPARRTMKESSALDSTRCHRRAHPRGTGHRHPYQFREQCLEPSAPEVLRNIFDTLGTTVMDNLCASDGSNYLLNFHHKAAGSAVQRRRSAEAAVVNYDDDDSPLLALITNEQRELAVRVNEVDAREHEALDHPRRRWRRRRGCRWTPNSTRRPPRHGSLQKPLLVWCPQRHGISWDWSLRDFRGRNNESLCVLDASKLRYKKHRSSAFVLIHSSLGRATKSEAPAPAGSAAGKKGTAPWWCCTARVTAEIECNFLVSPGPLPEIKNRYDGEGQTGNCSSVFNFAKRRQARIAVFRMAPR